MKQNTKYYTITVAVVVVIVSYIRFDLLKPYLYPCESIFQQTTTQIGGSIETLKTESDLFFVQTLSYGYDDISVSDYSLKVTVASRQ